MSQITTYDELKQSIEENEGLLTVSMRRLRDIHGADRLGVHVRSNISDELAGLGLGHYPEELPDSQHEHARIYKLGSPAAAIINAVLKPDSQSDAEIRKAASGANSRVLEKIRELLDVED
jgi:hypothetical protein